MSPLKIVLFYLAAGSLWILFTDSILGAFIRDIDNLTNFQTYKGLFYIALTALLLFVLIRRYAAEQKDIETALRAAVAVATEQKNKSDRDSAERQRGIETLQAMNEHMNVIMQTSPAAIIALAPNGRVTLWNNAAEKIFGWTADEAIGRIHPIVQEDKAEEFRSIMERIILGESTSDIELTRQKKDGSSIVISLSAAPLRNADNRVTGVIGVISDITRQKAMEEALKKSVMEYRLLFDNNPHPMWVYDLVTLSFLAVNDAAVRHYGYTEDEFLSMTIRDILPPEELPALVENIPLTDGADKAGIWRHRKKDDSLIYVETMSHTLDFFGRRAQVELVNDVTERARLEEQLRHAQKMEAVGQLAGGVAHDFNNILTAIIGYGNLVRMKMQEDDPLRIDVQEILEAAERASNLTRSLLAFSRKQIISPRPVGLNGIVKTVEKLLLRVIGEDIELRTNLAEGPLTVLADSNQLEQVLMNLATNARDAMPKGGIFIITTELVSLDREFIHIHGYGEPGLYALMSVEDTGPGMDEPTRLRVFEPFFTTKELGSGTGLGLSIAYGIIKQHNGYITVYSEPGKGTAFKIYLPVIDEAATSEQRPSETAKVKKGTETVLVAEDDETLRKLIGTVLYEFGYTVLTASDGIDAVDNFIANKDKIQLLVFDVVMPGMNGREAYDEIKKLSPDIKALFMSGYTANIIHKKGVLEEGLDFIHKPVSPHELLLKIREILDRDPLSLS